MQRRPKGRPKGSKTTRFRRDKGPGKSIKALGSRRTKRYPFSSAGNPDDIWVDVDETAGAGEDIAENEVTSFTAHWPSSTKHRWSESKEVQTF
ncbi:hypothetical protein HYQ46_006812 [Verticillium longisporum]|nr:hypothetical protein HYQ46_006812 [Verticillium longisporum]